MPAAATPWRLHELPENRLARRAAARLSRCLSRSVTPPFLLLTLHGPAGTGKSALIDDLLDAALRQSSRTARRLPATELRDDADRGDLLAADLLIVEDLQHLPAGAVDNLSSLLDDRQRRRRPTVLTANAPPARLKKLPRRLLDRLSGGLTLSLAPYGTASKAVLGEAYADHLRLRLEPEALDWLAGRGSHGSVRPLLGALEQLKAARRGKPDAFTLDDVKAIVSGEPDARPVEAIIRRVAETFGVKTKEILGPSRLRNVLLPRQVAMFLARDLGSLSLPRIGAHFGGRDHSTVLHAVNKIRTAIADDRALAGTIRQLKLELA